MAPNNFLLFSDSISRLLAAAPALTPRERRILLGWLQDEQSNSAYKNKVSESMLFAALYDYIASEPNL